MSAPKGQSWITLTHENVQYMVRVTKEAVWIVRLPDRVVWFFDNPATAPAWARGQLI